MSANLPPETPLTFVQELERLLNKHSMENGSNTPDFLLAEYLAACLGTWNTLVTARERWYGRQPKMLQSYASVVSSMPPSSPPSMAERKKLVAVCATCGSQNVRRDKDQEHPGVGSCDVCVGTVYIIDVEP